MKTTEVELDELSQETLLTIIFELPWGGAVKTWHVHTLNINEALLGL